MTYLEEPLLFDCAGDTLVGVMSLPSVDGPAPTTGVLIVVGGPQYKAGSHRQFVQLARSMSNAGHAVLRFDCRGMGDSTGDQRSFESLSQDISCGIQALTGKLPQLKRVVLFGLCDGAAASLLYLQSTRDKRVTGLCLVNPWVRSQASLARTHLKHYYTRRILDWEFWTKLLRGGVGLQRILEFAGALRSAAGAKRSDMDRLKDMPFQDRMALAWKQFDGRILLVLSAEDLTAKEFVEHATSADQWKDLLSLPKVHRVDVPNADHTMSSRDSREGFEHAMKEWLATSAACR